MIDCGGGNRAPWHQINEERPKSVKFKTDTQRVKVQVNAACLAVRASIEIEKDVPRIAAF